MGKELPLHQQVIPAPEQSQMILYLESKNQPSISQINLQLQPTLPKESGPLDVITLQSLSNLDAHQGSRQSREPSLV